MSSKPAAGHRIEASRSAGGLSYGYDITRQTDARGEPDRGNRAINAEQAITVQRIFQMTADGMRPIAIAKHLNSERIPGPGSRAWRDTTIRGHALRGTGILRNKLYIGRLIWNRMRFIKDPSTGKRISRMNPAAAWVVQEMHGLRIIDQDLWQQVRTRLASIRDNSGADRQDRPKFYERRRAQHVLSGKVFCAFCGSTFGTLGKNYLACSAARRQGVCANRQSIRRAELDELILGALKTQLMHPEHVALFVTEFTAEWNRLQGNVVAEQQATQKELDAVTRKLNGLIDAIADGLHASRLQEKLTGLKIRKAELERLLNAPPAPTVRLHPNLAAVYQEKVGQLHAALTATNGGSTALQAVRDLIDRVDVGPAQHPPATSNARPLLEITLTGEIAGMVNLGIGGSVTSRPAAAGHDMFMRSVKVVAGARNQLDLLLMG